MVRAGGKGAWERKQAPQKPQRAKNLPEFPQHSILLVKAVQSPLVTDEGAGLCDWLLSLGETTAGLWGSQRN